MCQLVLLKFGPELKFKPEPLRTRLKFSSKFSTFAEPDLKFSSKFSTFAEPDLKFSSKFSTFAEPDLKFSSGFSRIK